MALSGLSIDVNTLMGKFGLSIGDSGVQVKHIDMVKPQDELKIALDDFGYTVKLTEDDKNIAMQAAYKLGGLTVAAWRWAAARPWSSWATWTASRSSNWPTPTTR